MNHVMNQGNGRRSFFADEEDPDAPERVLWRGGGAVPDGKINGGCHLFRSFSAPTGR
ncbi:hypothetical protein PSMK_22710 [Phycisphaera mikurensis NBRC 102666]|uniref:Uncharacterized protein n=1 Tax=Phycisphaera mikurensis (strain NBRC 102666 / KCTC 22515 / FYK2301M01) TaxID=1142394 RepID=I0IGP2_PHYMF|nr:hypothetical protein PSMK_22710 [Phycisphaera mikurensis NBRC 102666]